jgi:hypothetical protein
VVEARSPEEDYQKARREDQDYEEDEPVLDRLPQREWSDEKDYEFHPLSESSPLMEGEEFEKFADDIKANGQQETVKIYEEKILDGRNRYRACKARKIPCRFDVWDRIGDPADYVLSMNLHRRHLTPEGRKTLVVELRKRRKSIREIAETLHTSYGSVHRDLQEATDPNGSVGEQALPTTVEGKDGKTRQATTRNKTHGEEAEKLAVKSKARTFSFSSEALIQIKILEPGQFQFTIEDSENGVINVKMYRKQMAELNTQIEKNFQDDDGFEPAEIPDK